MQIPSKKVQVSQGDQKVLIALEITKTETVLEIQILEEETTETPTITETREGRPKNQTPSISL